MSQPKLFRYRQFEPEIILLCLRWYLRYALSYRDLEEMMVERGLFVDHTTIYRWVQHYAPLLEKGSVRNQSPRSALSTFRFTNRG